MKSISSYKSLFPLSTNIILHNEVIDITNLTRNRHPFSEILSNILMFQNFLSSDFFILPFPYFFAFRGFFFPFPYWLILILVSRPSFELKLQSVFFYFFNILHQSSFTIFHYSFAFFPQLTHFSFLIPLILTFTTLSQASICILPSSSFCPTLLGKAFLSYLADFWVWFLCFLF